MARFRSVLAAAALAVPMLIVSLTHSGAADASSASAAPIYSRPQWWPLHDNEAAMDCAWSNPGCPVDHRHSDHAITFLTHNSDGEYFNANVYAAGRGIAHIGHSGMGQCSPTPGQPLGNWIWIDHGNGIVSRYAHLFDIKVTNGQQVYAHTVIAKSGSSGESASQCHTKYLNFQIQHGAHGAPNGTGYPFKTSYACNGSKQVTYPGSFSSYSQWNSFPKSVFVSGTGWTHMIPRGGHYCL